MTEKTLLASVVLFRELYDSDKDIYDVIAEFIKAALIFGQKWSVNTTETTQLLRQEFELSIPEAVVGTTLHKRLHKRDGILTPDKGQYTVVQSKLDSSRALIEELETVKKQQNTLLARLISYVEAYRGPLPDKKRVSITECFCDYLFDKSSVTRFSEDISSFIIKSQSEPGFTDQLNAVREGFVLYDGVRHTPDLSQIGAWQDSLTVYLDTEHLFNAVGFNGALHQQLFRDFIGLASDVRSKGSRLISLRYFSECADEVDRFFHVAELILDGKTSLDPSKPAMAAIIDKCSTKSDVITKKAKFLSDLKGLGITEADESVCHVDTKYNIESVALLEKLRSELAAKGREFNEEKCIGTLRMFTKINALRQGRNSGPFETVGHILVSGSYLANYLAFHPDIRDGNGGVPYATDLEFITNRLWFKLHKGLAKGYSHPQSLNVLAKAQVVLASQINSSVSERFDQIQEDYATGKLNQVDAQYLFNELRSNVHAPEALTAESVNSALEFLDHKDYQHHLRERSLLTEQAEQGRKAISELAAIRDAGWSRKRKIVTTLSFSAHSLIALLLLGFVFLCYYFLYKLTTYLATAQDSPLAILGLMVSLILGTAPLIKIRAITTWIKRSHRKFVDRIPGARA
jgi:hypothetical protein